jgi:SAM-dependent methyltransferase
MNEPTEVTAQAAVGAVRHQAPNGANSDYWDEIAAEWKQRGRTGVWRMVSDGVNCDLVSRWLPPCPGGSVLKTDLFDEFVGAGLVPRLLETFGTVTGIDISPVVVDAARARYPRMKAETADVRQLPFADGEFDAVVSNSTLDHFPSHDDIAAALVELHRVLRPGGTLLVTLDNPLNPVVAVRNALPERVRAATRLVPFAVGATYGQGGLGHLLEQTGFEVKRRNAVLHCPRVIVVLGGDFVDRHGGPATKRRYVRLFTAFEGLAKLPSRRITGHFVAALALKR